MAATSDIIHDPQVRTLPPQYGPYSMERIEHDPRLLSVSAANPFYRHNSSSREQMASNHLGQLIEVLGATEKKIYAGTEVAFAPFTFNVRMPANGIVLAIIPRYDPGAINGVPENPETCVIYEEEGTQRLGVVHLPRFCSNHQYFGFPYAEQPGLAEVRFKNKISKDTVFLDSPNISRQGTQRYGVECNVAMMTHPCVAEDGIGIRKGALHRFRFKTYERVVAEWGRHMYALNVHGTEDDYRAMPDIGDVVPPHGILMAFRSYEPKVLALVERSRRHTLFKHLDYTFDDTRYAEGPGIVDPHTGEKLSGRIVDITIQHDKNDPNRNDDRMDAQPLKYDKARRAFAQRVLRVYREHKARWPGMQVTPEMDQLVTHCLMIEKEDKQRVAKLYRKAQIYGYRVEFTIEYEITPTTGFKYTARHGDKGVLCQIIDDADMPRDADGNVADLVVDPNSTVARMNLGRLYEQGFNAYARDFHKELCWRFGLPVGSSAAVCANAVRVSDPAAKQQAWERLMRFYELLCPFMLQWFQQGRVQAKMSNDAYMTHLLQHGIYMYMPTHNPPEYHLVIQQLRQEFPLTRGPVTYTGFSGERVTTLNNVLIGSMYILLLEKTGDDWSAMPSGKFQHHGVLAPQTRADKNSKPTRHNGVRGYGEAEVRIVASNIGGEFVAEMMDRNNNIDTHIELVRGILKAPQPSNIENLIDRHQHPFGRARPLQLVKHLFMCGGIKLAYQPYDTQWDCQH